jgi:hypothetical protein
MPCQLLAQMDLKQLKEEHQVRYDGGVTRDKPSPTGPNQTAN